MNPGDYAVLLGSGISSSAGIPTGSSIVLDLIRKIALLRDTEDLPDPEKWYIKTFETRPVFGDILNGLRFTEEERRGVLVPYIEGGNDADQEPPQPTEAHSAIADLVKRGYIRIILTTNLDRLMERALHEISVDFDVISSEGGFDGAPAVHRTSCLVAKLHGDYREPGVRLTAKELEQYPPPVRRFLRKILQEFGLIICGWSGESDVALRESILRTSNHRFSSFWLSLSGSGPSEHAEKVISACRAQEVPIDSADGAFSDLLARVHALEESGRSHPESVSMVVQQIRQYATEDRAFPKLEALLHQESETLFMLLEKENTNWESVKLKIGTFHQRIHRYEELSERMAQVLATVAFYCEDQAPLLLKRCISRLAAFPKAYSNDSYAALQRYPALLLVYAAGMASIVAGRYSNLHAVLVSPEWTDEKRREQVSGIEELNAHSVFEGNWKKVLPCDKNYYEWLRPSFYISSILRQPLKRCLPDETEYGNVFDIFEFVQSLVHLDLSSPRFPLVGRFALNTDYFRKGDLSDEMTSHIGRFFNRIVRSEECLPLCNANFFGASSARLTKTAHEQRVRIADFVKEWA
jgi:type III secretion system FlhB-like substrate exporter